MPFLLYTALLWTVVTCFVTTQTNGTASDVVTSSSTESDVTTTSDVISTSSITPSTKATITTTEWSDNQNPDQKAYNECMKLFPNATYMSGTDNDCSFMCYGYQEQDFQYIHETPNKADGTICGEEKVCVNGFCHNKVDVDLCRENTKGTLKLMMATGCRVRCKTEGSQVLSTDVARQQGTPCYLLSMFSSFDLQGFCDQKGNCLAENFPDKRFFWG